jgi:DNA mismatch endonuclease Vsr
MADNLTGAQRRRTMQAIRAKNTKPEIITRQFLHREGFRFRLHDRSLPGVPDVVLKKYRTSAIPSFFEIKESGGVRTLCEKNLIVIF